VEEVGWRPILAAKLIVTAALGLVLSAVWFKGRQSLAAPAGHPMPGRRPEQGPSSPPDRSASQSEASGAEFTTSVQPKLLLRLAVVPLAAHLLLTTTVHPWYVTLIIPLLPFLLPREGETPETARFILPWLYFSAAVALSYLTYLDPANLREYDLVRLVEYVPLYLLLVWAAWPAIQRLRGSIGRGA
jgi:hypothetical protein